MTDAAVTGAGAGTVMAALALTPSTVALIVAAPADTPLTRPVASTLATPGALLLQLMVLPPRTLPNASLGVAVS